MLFCNGGKKENGEFYPPATIRSLLCGLNGVLKVNKAPFSIFDEDSTFKNHRFCE